MRNIIAALLFIAIVLLFSVVSAQERNTLDDQRISELRDMVENTHLDLLPLLKYARRPPSDGKIKTLPSQFSWHNLDGKDWMSPVRDQDGCGSCWTFGTLAALEAAMNIYLDDSEFDYDLSEQHMVSCGAGSCDDGGMAEEVLGYLKTSGIPDEACFPYEAEELECNLTCNDWQARAVKISDWGIIMNPTEQELKEELLNGPLPVTMKVTSGFYSYSGGVYVGSSETCNLITNPPNHVVALVGWDDSDNTWIAKNSWNTDWGIDGYIKIRRGTDCFATVTADWLRVDPPTIPGVEGDVALCVSPSILNVEVEEGTESAPIAITLQNCGDFATDWGMSLDGTWKYWIYPSPFNGTLGVDDEVSINLVFDAEQKEAGQEIQEQLVFVPALTGQSAVITINISITADEVADGDAETPPADEDAVTPDGDIDIDEELLFEADGELLEDSETEYSEVGGDGFESDGDFFENETVVEDGESENMEKSDGDVALADNDSESSVSENEEKDEGNTPGALQSTSSSGVCGMSDVPQGAAFILLCALLLVLRRRSAG